MEFAQYSLPITLLCECPSKCISRVCLGYQAVLHSHWTL